MTKILALISDGFASIADSYVNPREYKRPSRNGFQKDHAKLRGDVARVGSNLGKVITVHYGKQSHKLAGNKS